MPARPDRTLVTGFLAFGEFAVNPSALLAESSDRPFRLIEVAYAAADEAIAQLNPAHFDRLLMIGVDGRTSPMRLEQVARNRVGARPDVRGFSPCTGSDARMSVAIDREGPDLLLGTLWQDYPALAADTPHRRPGDDAGTYLCNYIYYRALARFGATCAVGFVHVPPLDRVPLPVQQQVLREILQIIEA
jgi:pyroglutamyl-peptidase